MGKSWDMEAETGCCRCGSRGVTNGQQQRYQERGMGAGNKDSRPPGLGLVITSDVLGYQPHGDLLWKPQEEKVVGFSLTHT